MGKSLAYYRQYNEAHRKQINTASRERYHAMREFSFAARPDVANERRVAFLAALEELNDEDVRQQIQDMIDATAAVLMERGNLKQYAAKNQAAELIGALVWSKATAPRAR